MNNKTDRLYASPLKGIAGFTFDATVVEVFPDMIKRSVPGYETIIAMTGTLAERYVQSGSYCYDLGCSLGASTIAMRQHIHQSNCVIVAVDNSPQMITRCREILDQDNLKQTPQQKPPTQQPQNDTATPVQLICGDIQDIDIRDASMVVLNFTLQFIPLEQRAGLLHKIAQGLRPGGILILSEKVAFDDPQHQALMIELHHNFKKANGYSDLEISQKRSSLENVLIPETLATHRQRLREAGFSSVDVWFQCFNFASLIAIK